MKNSFLLIRSSKSRQQSANDHRTNSKLKDRPSSNFSCQDFSDLTHSQPHIENSQKQIATFYEQELTRLDIALDLIEINQQNHSSPSLDFFPKILKDFSLCLKQKDIQTSNRLLRLALIFEKSQQSLKNRKNSHKMGNITNKQTRENFTQTLTVSIEEEIAYPDTSKEISFVRGLIDKFDKLRAPKLMNRLVDLHENLCKVDNYLPSPTESPEPFETNLNTQSQQLSIFVKVLKSEIKNLLSRNNVEIVKLNKSVQANFEIKSNEDAIKEKILENANLKSQIGHKEKELEVLKDNLAKCRGSLIVNERKVESSNLELIQITNKFRVCEDQLKAAKSKLNYLGDCLALKKERKRNMKKTLRIKEKELNKTLEITRGLKENLYTLSIGSKIAEEKLEQIYEAWKKLTGEEFEYKNVTSIEVSSKYNIYKPVENECLSPEEILTVKNKESGYRRGSSFRPDLPSGIVTKGASPIPSQENEYPTVSILPNDPQISPTPEEEKSNESFPNRSRKGSLDASTKNTQKKQESVYFVQSVMSQNEKINEPEKFGSNLEKPKLNNDSQNRRRESAPTNQLRETHKRRLSALTVENLGSSLSTIIENSPTATIPMGTFSKYSEGFSQAISETQEKKEHPPQAKLQHRRKGYEGLSLTLGKDPNLSVEFEFGDLVPRTPLLQCLINENEQIYKTNANRPVFERGSKLDQKNQEVQCTIIGDSPTKRNMRSPTSKNKKMNLVGKQLDPDTLENFTKLSIENGFLKDNEDIDSLPPAIQVEIIKCFEGHDSKRCEKFCVHLKRALALRYKERGVPYPIKTLLFNSQIE